MIDVNSLSIKVGVLWYGRVVTCQTRVITRVLESVFFFIIKIVGGRYSHIYRYFVQRL